jgi:hypothetical protein
VNENEELDASPNESRRDVVVLGAGFSHALNDLMPMTDELGHLALASGLEHDGNQVPSTIFQGGSFERWLSGLADDQPYLSTAGNLANRALFSRLSGAIRSVLAAREQTVLEQVAPDWLYELLSVLHVRRAHVITLNYDALVEYGVESHYLWDYEMSQRVLSGDVLDDLPPLRQPLRLDGSVAASFRLLKLHGSLSWFMAPGDEAGATLRRWETPGTFGTPPVFDEAARRRALPGTEPFIVPPAASKSPYYRNLVARELWQRASQALRDASRVILIGYSLPSADLTFSGMISSAVIDREVSFVVVNPHPNAEGVKQRLTDIGVPNEQVSLYDSPHCIGDFVRDYADELSTRVVERIANSGGIDGSTEGSLLVSWGDPETLNQQLVYAVTRIADADAETGDVVLGTGGDSSDQSVPLAPQPTQLGELVACLSRGRGKRIVVRTPAGRILPIVDLWANAQPAGDRFRWISLVAAGLPDG